MIAGWGLKRQGGQGCSRRQLRGFPTQTSISRFPELEALSFEALTETSTPLSLEILISESCTPLARNPYTTLGTRFRRSLKGSLQEEPLKQVPEWYPFALSILGPPFLKPNSRKKGTLIVKRLHRKPRAEKKFPKASLGGCSDVSVVEELLGELDWQGLTPNLEAFSGGLGFRGLGFRGLEV